MPANNFGRTPRTDSAFDSAERAAEYAWSDYPAEKWRAIACDMRDHARKMEIELSQIRVTAAPRTP